MFTDAEMKRLHEGLMDRMVQAGWLHCYTYTVGKGFHLTWTVVGGEFAGHLRQIVETFRLKSNDRLPEIFDKLAQGERLPIVAWPIEPDRESLALWRESLDRLGCPRDADSLLVLAGIVCTWGPDIPA